jgi:glutaminase
MKELLEEILKTCAPYSKEGSVATYIPELRQAAQAGLITAGV